METNQTNTAVAVITPAQMLEHWQGHRALTRKVIEAFPDDKLFSYRLAGMRPFSELAMEMIDMADGGIEGIATGKWNTLDDMGHVNGEMPKSKDELLQLWDRITQKIDQFWRQISPDRFQERDLAFGMYEGPIFGTLLYFIDNEIHHRGQGYVYLRSLELEPPPFWERQ